jgi:hypothetical protein
MTDKRSPSIKREEPTPLQQQQEAAAQHIADQLGTKDRGGTVQPDRTSRASQYS